MARVIEPLTDVKCRQAKPKPSGLTRLYDGGGLYLDVRSTSKRWRLKFRHGGKESTITLGSYPSLTLSQARRERERIKDLLSEGIHPVIERNQEKSRLIKLQNETFRVVAEEWLEFKKKGWGKHHYDSVSFFIRKDAYKYLENVPVSMVSAQDVLTVIREIESREALVLSHRVLGWIGQILSYAVGTGRIEHNVSVGLKQFLQERMPVQHHPYVAIERLPEALQQIFNYTGSLLTRCALKLQAHVFLRPAELLGAKWSEFDFEAKVWTVPASRMKGRLRQKDFGQPHLVPLSRQAIAILKEAHQVSGRSMYVFPSQKKAGQAPMYTGTIKDALERMGFQNEQSAHGFRGLASTILNESRLFSSKAIDKQLAHKPQRESAAELDYNHAIYLDERVEIMQWWSDFLDKKMAEYTAPEVNL